MCWASACAAARAVSGVNVTAVYKYVAFGSQRDTPPSVSNDYRFAGEERDSETDYIFLRAR